MKIHYSNTAFGKLRLNKINAAAHLTKTEVSEVVFDEKSGVVKNLICYTLPVLETADGVLSSSNSIIRYFGNSSNTHYGANAHEKALVDQWIDIIGYELEPAVYSVLAAVSGKDVDAQKTKEDIHKFLVFVNNHLNTRKFLVGDSITIADISLLSNLSPLFAHVLGTHQRKDLGHLTNWFTSNVSHFSAYFGDGKLHDKPHASFAGEHKHEEKAAPKAEKKKEEKKAEKKVEKADAEFDPFADDDAPAPASAPAPAPKPVAAKPEAKKKKEVIAKSIVVFDVKVYEQEEDLEKLAQKIYAEVKLDGLVWNTEHKILPVAFGMNKLQMACVIEDLKVSTEDIFALIEAWEDTVQSIDTVSFQKV